MLLNQVNSSAQASVNERKGVNKVSAPNLLCPLVTWIYDVDWPRHISNRE